MKFWQAITWMEPEQMLAVAAHAEQVGFDGLMLSDHGVYPRDIRSRYPYSADGSPPQAPDGFVPDCWASIGALAAATRTIRLAVGVYVLPLRNVFEVARATGTLAILSSGRLVLGAGLGWMKEEFDVYGVDFATRAARCDEMIGVLRRLWTGGMVEHHGTHFDFPPLQIAPAPPAAVPVYIGGNSSAALRRAARLGDGWISAGNAPEAVPGILAELTRLRREGGRDALPFETVLGLGTSLDVAELQRFGALGMGVGLSYPFRYLLGERSSVDQKKRYLDRFAEDVIRHCR